METQFDYLTIDTTEWKYNLLVDDGVYTSDSLIGLLWEVFKHRCWHLNRGDGWVD
tara:strand:+ start:213 stop:377 length:165 start_codon:yes stop_codon:yes gene_type:complete